MTGEIFTILADAAIKEYPTGIVAGIGIGTVFAGLVIMVVLLSVMNVIFSNVKPKQNNNPVVDTTSRAADEKMDDETVAAVSAALAETLGRDVSGIRITSIKKVN